MRINKFLAECGVASRRTADKLIEEGAVLVNGEPCTLGQEVCERDTVTVHGERIARAEKKEYYLMNKPKGYVCTVHDDKGRKTVMDLLPAGAAHVYPVGRLDYDTEGLLILTNDGELAFRLTHPKNEIPKTYIARVEGDVSDELLKKLERGIKLDDGVQTKRCKVRALERNREYIKVSVTLTEGRNRQVRRMFEAIGKEVAFLKRVKVGDLTLRGLDRGAVRKLSAEEVHYLKNL